MWNHQSIRQKKTKTTAAFIPLFSYKNDQKEGIYGTRIIFFFIFLYTHHRKDQVHYRKPAGYALMTSFIHP